MEIIPPRGDAARAVCHREHTTFIDKTMRVLDDSGQRCRRVRYEEFNDPAHLRALLEYLGVAPELPPLQEPPPNRGSSDVLSRFSNPEAAEAYLREHDLMHWARE